MATHHILKDGTSYAVSGGSGLVNGTKYQIGGGRTLIDGTVYEIGFAKPVTFVFNKTIRYPGNVTYNADFTSNGAGFSIIRGVERESTWGPTFYLYYNDRTTYIFANGSWTNEEYRTVTFAEMPTGALLTWLQANAVQQ